VFKKRNTLNIWINAFA